jgi:FkbH-like protein
MKCAVLGNVNVESIARRIQRHEPYVAQGYGAWTQELADPASGTWRAGPAAIFVVIDGVEFVRTDGVSPPVEGHLSWIAAAAARAPGTKLFVSNLDVPPRAARPLRHGHVERHLEHDWAAGILRVASAHPNVYLFDLKALVEEAGRAQFYSSKRWYLGGLRFSVTGERLLAAEMERILDAQVVARKKCLALDLDDTLWGGVVGEEGLAGIQLSETGEGARFKDFQRRIRELGQMGVILAVVSKNNRDDALEVFERHEHMVLKKEDFASVKIGWSPKPEGIAELARDLDIGLDSLVYVDDNPVEREAVRTALPEVTVPDFPADTCELAAFADALYKEHFFTLESTDEDHRRTEAYLANARRAEERGAAASLEDFLAGLRTKISLGRLRDEDIARAAQLTQKTNQFNLTTRRYTEQEIQAFRTAPGVTVSIGSVADKHGDNGKVFLGIVRRLGPDTAELDTFLMSCRVMGRFIEDQILDHLVRELRADGVLRLRVPLVPTRKNAPARSFVERLAGGRLVASDDSGAATWEFEIAHASPVTRPPYAELMTH